jgi:hypothetical protein
MNNRRIALGLGTGAGALLGAALLSGLTSPIAAADDYAILPDPAVGATNPMTDTLPAFGGLGTDTISTETFANYDTGTDGTSTPLLAPEPEAGTLTDVTNTYSNPLFTDTSTDITAATGSLAGKLGDETDTLLFDPSSGEDFGISLVSVPGGGTDAAPVVTEDLITPVGNFPISDLLGGSDLSSLFSGGDLSSLLGGSDLTSLLGGSDLTSLLTGGDLTSLLTGGDLLGGLDPLSLLTSFGL